MISITKTMRYPFFIFTDLIFDTWRNSKTRKNLFIQGDINSNKKVTRGLDRQGQILKKKKKKKENQIFFVAFMERLRKAKVFWLFKLPSSKHILHAGNQSPNLIQCWRILLIIKEWFGRGQWRTTFSNKS